MIKLILGLVLISYNVEAMEIKDLKVNGTACVSSNLKKISEMSLKENKLIIPMKSEAKLERQLNLERKVCQFSMTIALKPKEKIQISEVQQKIDFILSGQVESTTELSIYLAGKSNKLIFTDIQKAQNEKIKNEKTLGSLTEKIDSECGRDLIVRGSLSLLMTGVTELNSSLQADALSLKIESKTCL